MFGIFQLGWKGLTVIGTAMIGSAGVGYWLGKRSGQQTIVVKKAATQRDEKVA